MIDKILLYLEISTKNWMDDGEKRDTIDGILESQTILEKFGNQLTTVHGYL